MTTRTHATWTRFTVATLLLLTFCVAGALTGFRYGLSVGVHERRLADQKSMVYPVTYRIADLVSDVDRKQVDRSVLDGLVIGIEESVGPGRWHKNKGPCTIVELASASLLISAASSDHQVVHAYLDGRRKGLESGKR